MWFACGQEAPVESVQKTENKTVPDQEVSINKSPKQTIALIEGTLFFAKAPDCVSDCLGTVTHQVPEWTPQIALDSLYKGPSTEEGLRFLACGSTGAKLQTLEDGVAKVKLEGECGGCGTMSVYDLILPTLKAFPEIEVVQLYDANGKSQVDDPGADSRPACLEP